MIAWIKECLGIHKIILAWQSLSQNFYFFRVFVFIKFGLNILIIIILQGNGRIIHFSSKDFKGFTGLYSRKLKCLDNLLKLAPVETQFYSQFSFLNLIQRRLGESTFQGDLLLSYLEIPSSASPIPHTTCHYHLFWGEFQEAWTKFGCFSKLSPISSPCVGNDRCLQLNFWLSKQDLIHLFSGPCILKPHRV